MHPSTTIHSVIRQMTDRRRQTQHCSISAIVLSRPTDGRLKISEIKITVSYDAQYVTIHLQSSPQRQLKLLVN